MKKNKNKSMPASEALNSSESNSLAEQASLVNPIIPRGNTKDDPYVSMIIRAYNEQSNKLANTLAYNSGACSHLEDTINDFNNPTNLSTYRGSNPIHTNRERLALRTDVIINEALNKLCSYRTYFGHLSYFKGEEVSVNVFQTISSKMFELLCTLYENELKCKYTDMEPVLTNIQTIDTVINIFKRIYAEVYSDTVSKELLFKFENALCQHFCIDKL